MDARIGQMNMPKMHAAEVLTVFTYNQKHVVQNNAQYPELAAR